MHDRVVLITGATGALGRVAAAAFAADGARLGLVGTDSGRLTDPRAPPARAHPRAEQRVALAAAEAVERLSGVRPTLKWPNDLLVDSAKLAGILAQSGSHEGRLDHVVVGLGLNVGWAPPGAARVGDGVHPLQLLAELLRAFDELPDDLWPNYKARLDTLGRYVRVERAAGDVVGRAVDVERDGRLVVIDECAITHRIDTGDVIHLRPVDVIHLRPVDPSVDAG